jgi:hypothetical protein
MNIRTTQLPGTKQLTLDFTPGLTERYRSLRDCVATGVYQRGLSSVAIDLNEAPGNLSVQLSEDGARKFGIEQFEKYLEKTGDHTPIYYLIERFLHKPEAEHDAALEALLPALQQLAPLLKKAGLV